METLWGSVYGLGRKSCGSGDKTGEFFSPDPEPVKHLLSRLKPSIQFPHTAAADRYVVVVRTSCLLLFISCSVFSGATRQPYVSIVGVTDFGVQLKCEVRDAFPRPKLQWQDSDEKILSAEEPQVSKRGEHFDISLQTTVTKSPTNRFHCVVTQEATGHRNDATITVQGESLPSVLTCQ